MHNREPHLSYCFLDAAGLSECCRVGKMWVSLEEVGPEWPWLSRKDDCGLVSLDRINSKWTGNK